MDRILVVFYSYTGTCRQAAELLCAQHGWPRGEILETRARAGARGTLRCIADTVLRRRPAIHYDGPDPANYDAVVLVAPIWAYGLAGPMRSFIAQQGAALKRYAVVSVMGSAGASNAVAEIDRTLRRAPLIATAFTSREVEDGSCATRLQAFGRALQQATGAGAATADGTWLPRAA
jgi:flavodoxin